jgi:hypothetical protein
MGNGHWALGIDAQGVGNWALGIWNPNQQIKKHSLLITNYQLDISQKGC